MRQFIFGCLVGALIMAGSNAVGALRSRIDHPAFTPHKVPIPACNTLWLGPAPGTRRKEFSAIISLSTNESRIDQMTHDDDCAASNESARPRPLGPEEWFYVERITAT
jgi:hypothetical protein